MTTHNATVDAMRATARPQPAIDPHSLDCAERLALQARAMLVEAYKLVRTDRGMADIAERAGLGARLLAMRAAEARQGART